MKKTILFTNSMLSPQEIERLDSMGYVMKIAPHDIVTEEALIDQLQGVHAHILAGVERHTPQTIAAAKDLQVIAFFGADHSKYIPPDALAMATQRGIPVTTTPGANAQSVAEFVIGLALDLGRQIDFHSKLLKQGTLFGQPTWNLYKKTLGIIGMGHVGERLAHIAVHGFNMRVVYFSRSRKGALEEQLGIEWVHSLDALLRQADIVSLNVSETDETRGMMSFEQFKMMQPHAIFINTARPTLVDPVALKKALDNETIAAAAQDSYYVEPVTEEDDPFGLLGLTSDRFIATPHIAWVTDDSIKHMWDQSLESVLAALQYQTPPRVINPEYQTFNLESSNHD